MPRSFVCLLSCFFLGLSACGNGQATAAGFRTEFRAIIHPVEGTVEAQLLVRQSKDLLRELDLNMPAERYRNISADGELLSAGDRTKWKIPASGGLLSWEVYGLTDKSPPEAVLNDAWGIFKLEDIFPPARAISQVGAVAVSTLELAVRAEPADSWSIETAYGPVAESAIDVTEDRTYNRPKGWLITGDLGTRRDQIGKQRVTVTAPKGTGMRRMDTLTFLGWVLPEFAKVFPSQAERLLIVGAPEGMWRGGLSGFQSLYIHQGRPLVSENGTSTLLHELAHVAGLHSALEQAKAEPLDREAQLAELKKLRESTGL